MVVVCYSTSSGGPSSSSTYIMVVAELVSHPPIGGLQLVKPLIRKEKSVIEPVPHAEMSPCSSVAEAESEHHSPSAVWSSFLVVNVVVSWRCPSAANAALVLLWRGWPASTSVDGPAGGLIVGVGGERSMAGRWGHERQARVTRAALYLSTSSTSSTPPSSYVPCAAPPFFTVASMSALFVACLVDEGGWADSSPSDGEAAALRPVGVDGELRST